MLKVDFFILNSLEKTMKMTQIHQECIFLVFFAIFSFFQKYFKNGSKIE
jgi:hypothetical protein